MSRVNAHGVLEGGEPIVLVSRDEAPGSVHAHLYCYRGEWYHAASLKWGTITVGSGGYSWPAVVGVDPYESREAALDGARRMATRVLEAAVRHHGDSPGTRDAAAVLAVLVQPRLFELEAESA